MDHRPPAKPNILFLFSDTGGGHRSAADAIIEALNLEFPGQFTTEMIDFFKEYMPPPMNRFPEMYPPLSRMPRVWGLGYHLSNGNRRARLIFQMVYPYVHRGLSRLVQEHPANLIVSVHQLVNVPMSRLLANSPTPFITVVTDMVTTHTSWYSSRANPIIVPTEDAFQRGRQCGIPAERMRVIGLPVAERFHHPTADRDTLRIRLGWEMGLPVVMLVGGGEGMGPLYRTALSIEEANLPVVLVVVCGRNRRLRARLEARPWQIPVFIYGFVREMPDFMRASDVLVTKAGPGTLCEAFISGLPMILYSRMPGQEDGNVTFVVRKGAGVWAPKPEEVTQALKNWLLHPEERYRAANISKSLAHPLAARQIARILAEKVR
ncbi:MAG TPA: glycosyltransferase [Anaerolineaceae bacterium]